MRPIYTDPPPISINLATGAQITVPARIEAHVVRCACEVCGTHTNAVKAFRIAGSCPNCGSFRLAPVDGAEPLGGAPLAA